MGKLVRFIPYPVMGGFLAGTGWLLLQGSFGVMASFPLTLTSIPSLLQPEQLILWLPGVLFALILFSGLRRIKHFLALPGILVGAIVLFYVILLTTGTSITEATNRGLLLGQTVGKVIWQPLALSSLPAVNWTAILGQNGNIAIVLVLSVVNLLLNASALELAIRQDVNLNRELKAAGLVNLLSGLAGGMVGYHALSLSALSYRVGARGRLPGLVAGLLCLLVFVAGSALLAFFPKAILGGLLFFLGLDFLYEWVVASWSKLSRTDYAVVLLSLIVIGATNFLLGVGVGLVAMVVLFVLNYSRINVVHHALAGTELRSNIERCAYHRRPAEVLQSSVVKLFLQSARRVRPGFELAAGDVRHVAAICRTVSGMPLGVLLAAAWVEMLSPAEIAAEMQHSTDLLDSAGRPGTMRAVFDYAWGQLTPAERDVLGGLSVFRGGFTREAAQAVTGAGLRELLGLVNKSLLSRAASTRYDLHELLRQYAAEKLNQSGRTGEVKRRHLEYTLALAEQFDREFTGPGQVAWMQRLAAEIENIRTALAWSIIAGCPHAGLRLAVSLSWFWRNSGFHHEGREWLERLLAETPQPSADRIRALRRLANVVEDAGDSMQGIALCEQALATAEALSEPAAIAAISSALALRLFGLGDAGRAQQLAERSLTLCQGRSEMREEAADTVLLLGELAYCTGDPGRGQELHEQALALYQTLNRPEAAA